jgi:SNF2 family DNA or RNA helicase
VQGALHQGSKRLLGAYLQALLGYPDGCTRAEVVIDGRSGRVIAEAPALPEEVAYPKEQALIDLVHRERARNRRVLVYVTHTERRDLTPRLRTILEHEGLRVAVLKANTVSADRREEWVAARVREGADVLLCHPRLVQTGLDLVDWPSIVWFQPEYSVYVLRQESRRSWRIGQRHPVEVTYLVYQDTLQADALALIAAKMRSASMIEGDLPEDGLAAFEGDGHDLMLALARRLTENTAGAAGSLGALFA